MTKGKHKQQWNWTPKAYRWRDNLVSWGIILAILLTVAFTVYVIWLGRSPFA